MNQKKYNNWHITEDKDNIVWLALDKADSKTNVLSAEVLTELEAILTLYHNQPPRGLVVHSGKSTGFIAGADIKEFTNFASEADALAMIQRGQRIFNTLEELPCTTVAILTGYTLGGGMELSLACNYRIADNSDNCRMGLPEVKLGIHPGFGGSVRSIELIGPINAMDMMLTGRNLRARAAKKIGLIDYAVPERHLMEAARQTILKPPKRKPLPFWVNWINQAQIRPWFAKLLIKKVSAKAERAHYPAPYALIDLWVQHYGNRKAMLHEEALSVSRLLTGKTAQNLIRVFELQTTLKSLGSLKGYKPQHVHVIGGGVMGGDIAIWCALQGFQVSIQDQQNKTLAQVIKRAFSLYKKRLKRPLLISQAMDRLSADLHGAGLVKADIVIEAIFEDAEVKRDLFSKIEPLLKDEAIIATNTSSIPLEELTSSLKKPERLVGLHFFNPVAMMPLVEIVIGEKTSEEARQKASAFTKQISRLPLPVWWHRTLARI
jgi:3-hydroxyacyl-CoA dehydrogenase/enoyl-CoA hydratase/3-hydroxybutyryl-CoA epimerase